MLRLATKLPDFKRLGASVELLAEQRCAPSIWDFYKKTAGFVSKTYAPAGT
jgi:hypothetical protein